MGKHNSAVGLPTGAKTRHSENQNWLVSAKYYAHKGCLIQSFAQNLYGQTKRTDLQYNFAGEVLKSRKLHASLLGRSDGSAGGLSKSRLKSATQAVPGRSAAAVITCVKIVNDVLYLLSVYDKSEKEALDEKELDSLIKMAEI